MTIVKDMTKEMLRRGRNFGHLTVECQHVHNNFSLMRRASEYKCEIVNRITDVGYLSQSPPPIALSFPCISGFDAISNLVSTIKVH